MAGMHVRGRGPGDERHTAPWCPWVYDYSVRVGLLGDVCLLDGARVVGVGGSRERSLLAALAIDAGRVVSPERLIDVIWGDDPPPGASTTLRSYVSRLRKLLTDTVAVETAPGGYRLRGETDLAEVERLAADGHGAAAAGDDAAAVRSLGDALAHWRGRSLAGLADDRALAGEAARLDELRVALTEERAVSELALGRYGPLVGELEALCAAYPLRERLWHLRMIALYRGGRQAEALRCYGELRLHLTTELGIEPNHELQELERAILVHDPALSLSARLAPDSAVAQPSRGLPPGLARARGVFVGRSDEMRGLVGLWEESVAAGQLRVALVDGEPGIGKTRLVSELAALVADAGGLVLYGRCDEEPILPFQPFVEALQADLLAIPLDQLRRTLGREAEELARIVPRLGARLGVVPAASMGDAGTDRHRLFDAVSGLIVEHARRSPVLLVIDDIHWADAPTLLLVRHLLRSALTAPVTVALTFRDIEVDADHPVTALIGDLRRDGLGQDVSLLGLSVAEVAELVSGPVGLEAAELWRQTAGNPFYVVEIVRHVADGGGSPDSTSPALPLPSSVRDVLASRLGRLAPSVREFLVWAAVVGRQFRVDLVEQVSALSSEVALDALEAAVAARLVVEVQDRSGSAEFCHALIRDALHDELGPVRRARMHQKVGEALERASAARPVPAAELATHFLETVALDGAAHAVRYATAAGDDALRSLAYEEAVGLYRRALGVVEDAPALHADAHGRLLLSLGDARWRSGDTLGARETFLKATELAVQDGDATLLARAALGYGTGLGGYNHTVRANTTLIGLLERALEAMPTRDDALRVRLLSRLAVELYYTPSADRRERLTRDAVAMAERLRRTDAILVALYSREWCRLGPTREPADRFRAASDIVRLADEVGDRDAAYHGHFLRLFASIENGDLRNADEAAADAARVGAQYGTPGAGAWLASYWAMRAWMEGRFDDADRLVAEAMVLGLEGQQDPEPATILIGAQMMAFRIFRDGLCELIPTVEALVSAHPQHPVIRAFVPFAYREIDDRPSCRASFDDAMRDLEHMPVDANWLIGMWALSYSAAYLGDRSACARLLSDLEPYAGRWVTAAASICLGTVAGALAVLCGVIGRYDEADAYYQEAATDVARSGLAPLAAHNQVEHARMLLHRGRPSDCRRATVLLGRAAETARRLSMSDLLDNADTLAGQAVPG